MTVRAVVQARMSSRRLPGKSLGLVAGTPLLQHVVERAAAIPGVDEVVVATSDDASDDAIARAARDYGVSCTRGSLDDVLGRFVAAARGLQASDTVARVTADNPLYDAERSGRACALHVDGGWDYTYVRGLSHVVPELVRAGVLRRMDAEARDAEDREHVTPWLRRNAERFRVRAIEPRELGLDPALESLLTVDSAADRERVERMLSELSAGGCVPSLESVYGWLRRSFGPPAAGEHG